MPKPPSISRPSPKPYNIIGLRILRFFATPDIIVAGMAKKKTSSGSRAGGVLASPPRPIAEALRLPPQKWPCPARQGYCRVSRRDLGDRISHMAEAVTKALKRPPTTGSWKPGHAPLGGSPKGSLNKCTVTGHSIKQAIFDSWEKH